MIPENIKQLANKVRNEIYGRDVRESIAQSMEVSGETSNEANERSKDTDARQTDVENRFDDQIAGNTDIDEVIDARRPEGGESYPTLRKRLDDEHKEVTTQLEHIAINVKKFGAKGDGVTDDTESIQDAIDFASSKNGGKVIIPDGVYMVKGHVENTTSNNYLRDEGGIELKDDIHLFMSPNTELRAIPNSEKAYQVLRIYNKKNVVIEGGTIKGERYNHTGTLGEFGYGISIQGGSNIQVRDVYVCDMWGDGINIQVLGNNADGNISPRNITIERVTSDNNRRQGMSIEGLINGVVRDSKFINTNGTSPEGGVDIEPWSIKNIVENVVFDNCIFDNNNGSGFIAMGEGVSNIKVINSNIRNNKSNEGYVAIYDVNNIFFSNINTNGRFAITTSTHVKILNSFLNHIIINNSHSVDIQGNNIYTDSLNLYTEMINIPKYNKKGTPSTNIKIKNNHCKGNYSFEGTYTSTGYGTYITSGSSILVEDNKFEDINRPVYGNINSLILKNNNFLNCGMGVSVVGSYWHISDNIFEGTPNNSENAAVLNSNSNITDTVQLNNIAYKYPINKEKYITEASYRCTNVFELNKEENQQVRINLNNTFIENNENIPS